MFTVQGFRDGRVPYTVIVGGEGKDGVGVITGGSEILALDMEIADGQEFRVPPVGPTFTLDKDEPWSVLQWLHATTVVTEIDGEVPDDPDPDPDMPKDAVQ